MVHKPILATDADIIEVCGRCLDDYSENRTNVIFYRAGGEWRLENYILKDTDDMQEARCNMHPFLGKEPDDIRKRKLA